MNIYGLTGGIASGKSAVADILRSLGEQVIDADVIARDVVRPGEPAIEEIRKAFGDTVLQGGTIDRQKLAEIVFSNPEARARLNAILHPRIGARFAALTQALVEKGIHRVVYEAPLIVENGLQAGMAGLIVVSVPESMQVARLMRRDGIDLRAAQARLAAQLPVAEKLKAATWVIDNSGTLDETREQIVPIVEGWKGPL